MDDVQQMSTAYTSDLWRRPADQELVAALDFMLQIFLTKALYDPELWLGFH